MRFTLLAATAALLTLPAAVQAQRPESINAQQARLEALIDRNVANGRLTRAEARSLRAEYSSIDARETAFRVGGMSQNERNRLRARLNRLEARIRAERRDGQRR